MFILLKKKWTAKDENKQIGVGLGERVGLWVKILAIFRRDNLLENSFRLFTEIYNVDISNYQEDRNVTFNF